MENSITILPETDDRTLCVHITGIITLHDYKEFFVKPLHAIIAKHGEYNLYAYYSHDYQSWTVDAADFSFKCYAEVGMAARKSAYVNAPDSRHLILKMLQPLMPKAEIRFFDEHQQEEAMAWVKSKD